MHDPAVLLIFTDDDALGNKLVGQIAEYFPKCAVSVTPSEFDELAISKLNPQLILLDLEASSRRHGLLFLTKFRESSNTPVISLSRSKHQVDRVLSLKLGSDDCVSIHTPADELAARIEAVLRRSTPRHTVTLHEPIHIGEIVARTAQLYRAGHEIHLSPTQYRLFRVLALKHEIVPMEVIAKELWGYADEHARRAVVVHIGRLRAQLVSAGVQDPTIETIRKRGYRLRTGSA